MAGCRAKRGRHDLGLTYPHTYSERTDVKRLAGADLGRICRAHSVWCGEGGAIRLTAGARSYQATCCGLS